MSKFIIIIYLYKIYRDKKEVNLLPFFEQNNVNKQYNQMEPTEEQLKACFQFHDS